MAGARSNGLAHTLRDRGVARGDRVIVFADNTIETVIAFWSDERRHHFKVFKPVAEVVVDDLPYAWLKDALAVQEGVGWDCC